MPRLLYKALEWYWQVSIDPDNVWSSARLAYVSTLDPDYQAFLTAGGSLNVVSNPSDLNEVMTSQVLPAYLAGGLAVQSQSNSALNSIYALDNVTLNQIGTVARDSACGLGFPLGYATFSYPDIYNVPQTFTAIELQGLYIALRDYTASVYMAVSALVYKRSATLPTQPVSIP